MIAADHSMKLDWPPEKCPVQFACFATVSRPLPITQPSAPVRTGSDASVDSFALPCVASDFLASLPPLPFPLSLLFLEIIHKIDF